MQSFFNQRRVIIIALVVGVFASAGAIGAITHNVLNNTIEISVRERGGTNIELEFPAVLVSTAIAMVPTHLLVSHCDLDDLEELAELSRVLPFLTAAQKELERIPDCTLVAVSSDDEKVWVRKEGGRMIIDVVDAHDRVHIAFPIDTVSRVIKKLDRFEHAASQRHWDL